MANLKVQPVNSDQVSPEVLLMLRNQNRLIRAIHAATTVADIKTAIEVGGAQEVVVFDPHPDVPITPLPATTEEA